MTNYDLEKRSYYRAGIGLTLLPAGVLGGVIQFDPIFSLVCLALSLFCYFNHSFFWKQVFTNPILKGDLKKLIIGNLLLSLVFFGYFWMLFLIPYGYFFFHFMQEETFERIMKSGRKEDE